MYIAYSALRNTAQTGKETPEDEEIQQRLQVYQATCQKYQQEITAIQKYFPGWIPAFEARG